MGRSDVIATINPKAEEKVVVIGDSTRYEICDVIYSAMKKKSCDPTFLLLDAFSRPIFDSVVLGIIKRQLGDAAFIVDGATYREEEQKLISIVKVEEGRLENNYFRL